MAKLIFVSGPFSGKSVVLPKGKSFTIGRNRDIDLPLPDIKLSRRHCLFELSDGGCALKDLKSTNGTFINGTKIQTDTNVEIHPFDRIAFGDTEVEFQIEEKPLSAVKLEDLPEAEPLDPLAAALRELDLPLPPEPPTLALSNAPPPPVPPVSPVPAAQPILVCAGCATHIPRVDWELGAAKEIEGRLYCKTCVATGVKTSVSREAAAQPKPRPPLKPEKSISHILAALDGEAEVVDTTLKRRGVPVDGAKVSAKEQPVPAAPPRKSASETSDDLEEIGESYPSNTTQRAFPGKPQPRDVPAPPEPRADSDQKG